MSMASGTAVPVKEPSNSGFIIGPVYDSMLIIGCPLFTLLLSAALFSLPESAFLFPIREEKLDLRFVFIAAFTTAHLFLVFFRSHANANIFREYPLRFTVVPLVLLLACGLSVWVAGLVGVIVIWWDVYHSSLQTFGFGRIYDAKRKNNPVAGRRLDYWMNLMLYTGPVLAGVHFINHIRLSQAPLQFLATDDSLVSDLLLRKAPDFLTTHQGYLAAVVLSIAVPFLIYYLYSYYLLQQQGYQISWQKVWLLTITGAVSIYVWGFRSFVDAFWIMNFFHALQYFAIVWFMEHKNITRLFRLQNFSFGKFMALVWTVTICFLFGLWAGYYATGAWMTSVVLTTSILHFWYDGFIWSVKKKLV